MHSGHYSGCSLVRGAGAGTEPLKNPQAGDAMTIRVFPACMSGLSHSEHDLDIWRSIQIGSFGEVN